MKGFKLVLLAMALVAIGMVVYFAMRPTPVAPRVEPAAVPSLPIAGPALVDVVPTLPTPSVAPTAKSSAPDSGLKVERMPNSGYVRISIPKGAPIPELFPHQAERETIQRLGATYDREQIPVIAGYFTHADRTVRESAAQALLQIGDVAALPYLETAAKRTRDEEEKRVYLDAIDFLGSATNSSGSAEVGGI